MKFYNAAAPSPRRVRIFLAEKGIDIERVDLDLFAEDTRSGDFLEKNSLGEVPLLELEDGTVITEAPAICRYLEELHPTPALFGEDALERAKIEMWDRRIEGQFLYPLGLIARHSFDFFKGKLTQVPAAAEAQRGDMAAKYAWLDEALSDGRPFIAGAEFSVADITWMAASMVAAFTKAPPDASLTHLQRLDEALRARPSWGA